MPVALEILVPDIRHGVLPTLTVFKLYSSDGLSLDVGFRNSTSGGATTRLDEFNFFTNVNVWTAGTVPVNAG